MLGQSCCCLGVNIQLLQQQLLESWIGLEACGQRACNWLLQVDTIQLQANLLLHQLCWRTAIWLLCWDVLGCLVCALCAGCCSTSVHSCKDARPKQLVRQMCWQQLHGV